MKRFLLIFTALTILVTSTAAQTIERGAAWSGYVKRGKVKLRAGGGTWAVNGISVSHVQERYPSSDAARYVLRRFKGEMRPGAELTPNAASFHFKVTQRRDSLRIAWVCGLDLHYIETKSYDPAVTLLAKWMPMVCN